MVGILALLVLESVSAVGLVGAVRSGGASSPLPAVEGSAYPVTLPPGEYLINYTETGLPAGTAWSVVLGELANSSTDSTVGFILANATYSFLVEPVVGYAATPPSGNTVVNGQNLTVPIVFAPTYLVSFVESGLPAGKHWTVVLNGSTSSTNSTTNSFEEPNGTYSYAIQPLQGWETSNPSGSVEVAGASPTPISVPWTQVTYPVEFYESGLPPSALWSLTFQGYLYETTAPSLGPFYAPNGTYNVGAAGPANYAPDPTPSPISVDGAPASETVQFAHLWEVTFYETGLPAGKDWGVRVNGTRYTATTPSLELNLTNGSYAFSLDLVSGYAPTPASGNFSVAGPGQNLSISWARVYYLTTFDESGLPSGVDWTVYFAGYQTTTGTSPVFFSVPNGTFPFQVLNVSGFSPNPISGEVTVAGSDPSPIMVQFWPTYPVEFEETNLSANTTWTVTLGGNTASGTGADLTIPELPGNYSFSIGAVRGYRATPASGAVTVPSGPVTVAINWTAVTYPLLLDEQGLPSGVEWAVTIGMVPNAQTQTSLDSVIDFPEPNGTYHYSVGSVGGAVPVPDSGDVTINGGGESVTITFHAEETFTVTFVASGFNEAANWSVSLEGVVENGSVPTIAFVEPNGTFAYAVSTTPEYTVAHPTGNVKVAGANTTVDLSVTQVTFTVAFLSLGLPSRTTWSVNFSGTVDSTSKPTIDYLAANGTYTFAVGPEAGYVPDPQQSSVTVNGNDTSVNVQWSAFVAPVRFTESTLPAGTDWWVNLTRGASLLSNTTSLTFLEPNGTYGYRVGSVPGWVANESGPGSGKFVVNSTGPTILVAFQPMTFLVEFVAYGLPAGSNWTIEIGGTSLSTSGSAVFLNLTNGTYPYTVSTVAGPGASWVPTVSVGVLTVAGAQSVKGVFTLHFSRVANATGFTLTPLDEQLLVGGIVVILFVALIGLVVRPLNRQRRTGPNPLLPPPDVTYSSPATPSAPAAPAPSGGGPVAAMASLEIAPTPQNRAALLAIAVKLGTALRGRNGPSTAALGVELRRVQDLIASNRLTEAKSVLDRIVTRVRAPSRSKLPNTQTVTASNASLTGGSGAYAMPVSPNDRTLGAGTPPSGRVAGPAPPNGKRPRNPPRP